MNLRMGRIGIFDLAKNEPEEVDVPEALDAESASAVLMSQKLAEEHGPDALVLSTGLLAGSLVPAACAGLVRGRPSVDGKPRLMPLLGFAGVELKLSGYDHIVVKGASKTPGYLWIRDGMIEFVESAEFASLDSWARTDKIRTDQGDAKIQVLTVGQAGDDQLPASQVIVDYWGGEDKAGIGADFGRKKLVAVAFRGMGELEVASPDDHFLKAVELRKQQMSALGASLGLESYCSAVARDDFKKITHRVVGCFGCPIPCRTFVKVAEDPKEMRLGVKEPGYLHYDVPALEIAFSAGMGAREATLMIMKCARAGVEPCSTLVNTPPPGNFERSFPEPEPYLALLGLGLCPRYWAKAGFDVDAINSVAEPALGQPLPR